MNSTAHAQKKILDHFNSCNCEDCQLMVDYGSWRIAYIKGYRPARYPVPAIPVRTGFVPSGSHAMRGVPYVWLMYGCNRITTFWKGLDAILEWYDVDGTYHIVREVKITKGG